MTGNADAVALDPAAGAFVAAAHTRWPAGVESADAHRVAFGAVQQAHAPTRGVPITERWHTIRGPDHRPVRIRLVQPAQSSRPSPAVLYLHGGGWVAGDASTHDRIVCELAVQTGAAVIFPEYTRAPEARYPVAVDQAYATARWLVQHGAGYGLDPTRLAVAGDSEGANLALSVTLLGVRRNTIGFRQLVVFTPVTDAGFTTESHRTFAQGYGLRRDTMQWFWDQYAPDPRVRQDPTVSPLRADSADLARFPPSLIITAEADVVRDDGEAFAARLRAAGAASAAVRYEGTIHDFVVLNALADSGAAKAATAQAVAALQEALAAPGA